MRWFKWLGIILLCAALICLLFTLLPSPLEQVTIPLSRNDISIGTVMIRYPAWQWAGDTRRIVTSFQLNDLGQTDSSIALIARLETAAEQFSPRGEVSLAMQAKGEVTFTWKVATFQQANYPGTVWVTLAAGSDRELLLARDFSLHSRGLPGLELRRTRIVLGGLAFFGFLLLAASRYWPILKRKIRNMEN